MFTFFNRKKKEDYDYIGKMIDNQGAILRIVEEQRVTIKKLQETVKKLQEDASEKKKEES